MAKIKRSDFAMFLNTTPSASSATWSRVGEGVTSLSVAYNTQTTSETYIHEDNARTSVDSYNVNAPVPQTAVADDDVFEYVDGLRKARSVGEDCETQVLMVYIYDSTTSGGTTTYAAEQNDCTIQIDDFGGDGGASNVLNYTINFNGDPTIGTCTITNGVPTFTAS